MDTFFCQGIEAYKNQEKLKAANFFKKALTVAELKGESKAAKYRSWLTESFLSGGRLGEAIAMGIPSIQRDLATGCHADIFNSLATFIMVGISLPLPLQDIEKAFFIKRMRVRLDIVAFKRMQ